LRIQALAFLRKSSLDFSLLWLLLSQRAGFDLAVVKRMTKALGETVAIESEVRKGVKFIMASPPKKKNERLMAHVGTSY
jgi:hypothetical protein